MHRLEQARGARKLGGLQGRSRVDQPVVVFKLKPDLR